MPGHARVCPACSAFNPSAAYRCTRCGRALSATTPVAELVAAQRLAAERAAGQPLGERAVAGAGTAASVASVAPPPRRAHDETEDVSDEMIGLGVAMLVLGALITGITYAAAGGGGTYVITTGLFMVGVIRILQGIARKLGG